MLKSVSFFTTLTVVILATGVAFAQGNADWVQPATSLIESLESGLIKIGTVVVGIGIIVVGLIACLAQRMDWSKFGYVVMGGILIMTGPAALRALLSVAS